MTVYRLLERANFDALAVAIACGFLVAPWGRQAARIIGQVCYYPRGTDAITRNAQVMCALLAGPLDGTAPVFSAPGSSGDAAWRRRVVRARFSLRAPPGRARASSGPQ